MNQSDVSQKLKGVTVNVFEKPLTRERFEGAAKVKKVLDFDSDTNLARCRVKFKQDGFVGERFILVANLAGAKL